MASDGSWRVAVAGMLHALSPSGDHRWSRSLWDGRTAAAYHSAPLTIDDGHVVLTLAHVAVRYDGQGRLQQRVGVADGLDDPGCSPNLTDDGALITGPPFGDVYSTAQPIVDLDERIFAVAAGGVICYDDRGSLIFTTALGASQPHGMGIVADGTLACLIGQRSAGS